MTRRPVPREMLSRGRFAPTDIHDLARARDDARGSNLRHAHSCTQNEGRRGGSVGGYASDAASLSESSVRRMVLACCAITMAASPLARCCALADALPGVGRQEGLGARHRAQQGGQRSDWRPDWQRSRLDRLQRHQGRGQVQMVALAGGPWCPAYARARVVASQCMNCASAAPQRLGVHHLPCRSHFVKMVVVAALTPAAAWHGGSQATYKNWRQGEPNDWQGREDCASM